jgi:alpha-beta hydrolase superfamily lysophospholipase
LIGVSYSNLNRSLSRPADSEYKKQRIEQGMHLLDQLHARHIDLTTHDGIHIAALVISAHHPKRVVIMCHGFQSSKELMADCVRAFHDHATTFILFDFRSHGQSGGTHSSLGFHEQKDLEAVIEMVKNDAQMKNVPLYGMGVSMGGAILLAVASQHHVFNGLIIESTFADLNKQLERSYSYKTGLPLFPFSYISRYLFEFMHAISLTHLSPIHYLENIKVPILFIHAEDDKVTPLSDIEQLYEHASSPKYKWIIHASKHGQICRSHPEEYSKRVHTFFKLVEHEKK